MKYYKIVYMDNEYKLIFIEENEEFFNIKTITKFDNKDKLYDFLFAMNSFYKKYICKGDK